MSIFKREAGTSTFGWRAPKALRIRVSMSAIGSDVTFFSSPFRLPTGFYDSGDLASQSELAETDPAEMEFPDVSSRAATSKAAVPVAAHKLRLF
jgi:hypothetical protein